MIVSFNFYYAQPGLEDAVLRQRLRACEVRERLAIPRGRVLSRTSGTGELPDVICEQRFVDVAEHLADMDVRAASPDFASIRTGMRKLYRRFERPLFEIYGDATSNVDAPAPSYGTVMLDWIFCDAEKTEQIVELLQQNAAHDETSHPGNSVDAPDHAGKQSPGTRMATRICEYRTHGGSASGTRWKIRPDARRDGRTCTPRRTQRVVSSLTRPVIASFLPHSRAL